MLIIGIAGGSGCGKTTMVKKIISELPKNTVAVIFQDSYYKDNSHIPINERAKINFDFPEAIEFGLLQKHLLMLKKNQVINMPVYSYITSTRRKKTISVLPRKIIIVEGLLIFANEQLRKLFDLKVFIDVDEKERFKRIASRDIKNRGRTKEQVLKHYKLSVNPMHKQFIEPTKKYADMIIPNGGLNKIGIDVLVSKIKSILEK